MCRIFVRAPSILQMRASQENSSTWIAGVWAVAGGGLLAPHGVKELCVGFTFFQLVENELNGGNVIHRV